MPGRKWTSHVACLFRLMLLIKIPSSDGKPAVLDGGRALGLAFIFSTLLFVCCKYIILYQRAQAYICIANDFSVTSEQDVSAAQLRGMRFRGTHGLLDQTYIESGPRNQYHLFPGAPSFSKAHQKKVLVVLHIQALKMGVV